MVLYGYFRSSAAYRVRIRLNLKGLAYDQRSIHLRKGEQRAAAYLEVNPQGLVPALVVGSVRLTQSLAIMEYLDETHPEPPLHMGDQPAPTSSSARSTAPAPPRATQFQTPTLPTPPLTSPPK